MAMPPDLDAAFRKFIPPFGAAGNPVDITGGEPPTTYRNTIKLGLEDPRIHALILGYWHTIITPPMVFAKLASEVIEELPRQGHRQAGGRVAGRRRRGRGGVAISVRSRHPRLSVHDGEAGRGAGREVSVGAPRRPAVAPPYRAQTPWGRGSFRLLSLSWRGRGREYTLRSTTQISLTATDLARASFAAKTIATKLANALLASKALQY